MAGGGLGGVVGDIHALEVSNIKRGTSWKAEVARGVAEWKVDVDDGAEDAEVVKVQGEDKVFDGGEAKDGICGDVIAKGYGDGDAVAFVGFVGGRVVDDGSKEAMSEGVEILGV